MASHKLSSIMFFLLFGIAISSAARVLTTSNKEGYGYPNNHGDISYSSVGENGVKSYDAENRGGYNPKGYGYGTNENDYYRGWGRYGQGGNVSCYSRAPGYDYHEAYGQDYGDDGGKCGRSSFKEYDNYTSVCKDGGVYKYSSHENNEKAGELSKEYVGYRYGGKSGESFKENSEYNAYGNGSSCDKCGGMYKYPDYESSDKGEKSSSEYRGRVYGGGSDTKEGHDNVIYKP